MHAFLGGRLFTVPCDVIGTKRFNGILLYFMDGNEGKQKPRVNLLLAARQLSTSKVPLWLLKQPQWDFRLVPMHAETYHVTEV